MPTPIDALQHTLAPLRQRLAEHPVYELLGDVDDVRRFAERHVYAVWDFMSLLKALQRELTCVSLPWRPAPDAAVARFVNEVVLDEETDTDADGRPASHFELYLAAMRELGADPAPALAFVRDVRSVGDVAVATERHGLGPGVRAFLSQTFDTIASGAPHRIAAAFTFGREDLLPDVFLNVLARAEAQGQGTYPKLEYYLRRHIELDGDEHGPIALRMVSALCGDDEQRWAEATETASAALEARLALWDEVAAAIRARTSAAVAA